RVDVSLDILKLGDREINILVAGAEGTLLDIDETLLIRIDQGAKENAAHEAEDGGIGADTEREGDDDGKCEAFGAGERAKGKSQILSEQSECLHGHSLLNPGRFVNMRAPLLQILPECLRITSPKS